MPRRNSPHPRDAGFSLVELMVALGVLGLLTAAVVLSLPPAGGSPATEASRFAARAAAVRDGAIVTGTPQRLWVAPSGYGVERRVEGEWRLDPAEQHDWAEGAGVTLNGGGRVTFDALGLPDQALELAIARGDTRVTVRIDGAGSVTVQ